MAKIGGKFTDMTALEWAEYELARQEKCIKDIADLEWEEYSKANMAMMDHIAKAEVLSTIVKKLKETN